jgi:hypothetical protein
VGPRAVLDAVVKRNSLRFNNQNFMDMHAFKYTRTHTYINTHRRVYLKVSRLASWNENCKWYGSLALGAVVSLFCESV